MASQVSLLLTKELDAKGVRELTSRIIENYDLFEKLQKVIDSKIEEAISSQVDPNSFEKPAWSEYQAYLNGQVKALRDIKTLLKLRD